MSLTLANGNTYVGSTNKAMLPHGNGKERKTIKLDPNYKLSCYFLNLLQEYLGENSKNVVYEGQWFGGHRSGSGTLFYPGGKHPKYAGQFKRYRKHFYKNWCGGWYFGHFVALLTNVCFIF